MHLMHVNVLNFSFLQWRSYTRAYPGLCLGETCVCLGEILQIRHEAKYI